MPNPSSRHIEPLLPQGGSSPQFLVPDAATVTISAHAPAVVVSVNTTVPFAEITLAALTPSVTRSVSVAVPFAAVALAAQTPAVVKGAVSPAVPFAPITITVMNPSVILGGGPISVLVPAATITVTAMTPTVTRGAVAPTITVAIATFTAFAPSVKRTMSVPAAVIVVSAQTPVVVTTKSISVPFAPATFSVFPPAVILGGATPTWHKAGPLIGASRVPAVIALIDTSLFVGTYYFEAMIRTTLPTHPCSCRLWNRTDGVAVANSTVQTTAQVPTRVRSAALVLSGAKEYDVEFSGPNGADQTWHAAKVIVSNP